MTKFTNLMSFDKCVQIGAPQASPFWLRHILIHGRTCPELSLCLLRVPGRASRPALKRPGREPGDGHRCTATAPGTGGPSPPSALRGLPGSLRGYCGSFTDVEGAGCALSQDNGRGCGTRLLPQREQAPFAPGRGPQVPGPAVREPGPRGHQPDGGSHERCPDTRLPLGFGLCAGGRSRRCTAPGRRSHGAPGLVSCVAPSSTHGLRARCGPCRPHEPSPVLSQCVFPSPLWLRRHLTSGSGWLSGTPLSPLVGRGHGKSWLADGWGEQGHRKVSGTSSGRLWCWRLLLAPVPLTVPEDRALLRHNDSFVCSV